MNIKAISPLLSGQCIRLLILERTRLPIIDVSLRLSCKREHSHSRLHIMFNVDMHVQPIRISVSCSYQQLLHGRWCTPWVALLCLTNCSDRFVNTFFLGTWQKSHLRPVQRVSKLHSIIIFNTVDESGESLIFHQSPVLLLITATTYVRATISSAYSYVCAFL